MTKFIPLSEPNLIAKEWDYVKKCLDDNWVSSSGKYLDRFESQICKYTKSKYAVACVNGTSALHISLLLAGVKSDHEVLVPSLAFISPVNAIHYCNAHPVFMDSDNYYNIDSNKTIEFINKETYFKDGVTYNKITENKNGIFINVLLIDSQILKQYRTHHTTLDKTLFKRTKCQKLKFVLVS